jgi:DNA-binding FadR family transcriptional regulator
MYRRFENHFDTRERHMKAIEEHGRILTAIRSRDPEAARAAMHAHLDAVRHAFALTLDDSPEPPSTGGDDKSTPGHVRTSRKR